MKTAFASDPRFEDHDTGHGHPERASRLSHTLKHLKTQSWFSSLDNVPAVDCEPEWLASVHHRGLIERARVSCEEGLPYLCLLYTSPSPRDGLLSRMPSSA